MLRRRYIALDGGDRASLSLDFTTGSLDSRVTFSRPSLATMYDSTGKLTYCPNNLLTYSNDFTNAVWGKTNVSVTSGVTDPNGGTNAFTITATAGSAQILQTGSATSNAQIGSIWIRRRTGTGAISFIATYAGGVSITGTITSSWQRISQFSASGNFGYLGLTISTNGDAVDVYGAQVEAVTYQTTPGTYVETTSSAYYGPRFDYNPSTLAARGLLIEESRTNICTYSQALDNAFWSKDGATVSPNAAIAPDGTTTADKLVEDTTVSGGNHRTYIGVSNSVATYTYSIYAKAAGRTKFHIRRPDGGDSAYVLFDLSAVSYTDFTGGVATATITSVGDGWYRCTVTATSANSIASYVLVCLHDNSGNRTYTGDGSSGIYFWGGQAEIGSFATSYIPTDSASVARSADSVTITGTNFSSWYNDTAGTFVVTGSGTPTTYGQILSWHTGGQAIIARDASSTTQMYSQFGNSAQITATLGGGSLVTSAYKVAATISASDRALVANGGTVVTGAAPILPVGNLGIGGRSDGFYINGHIATLVYYRTRLSNTRLQALTQ